MPYDQQWVYIGPEFSWLQWAQTPEAADLQSSAAVLAAASEGQLTKLLTTLARQNYGLECPPLEAYASGLLLRIVLRRLRRPWPPSSPCTGVNVAPRSGPSPRTRGLRPPVTSFFLRVPLFLLLQQRPSPEGAGGAWHTTSPGLSMKTDRTPSTGRSAKRGPRCGTRPKGTAGSRRATSPGRRFRSSAPRSRPQKTPCGSSASTPGCAALLDQIERANHGPLTERQRAVLGHLAFLVSASDSPRVLNLCAQLLSQVLRSAATHAHPTLEV
nr:hypothetical protein D3W47_01245 [Deinococcus sp. RM]